MAAKQQYLEGPWNRVSGSVPLTSFELEGWRDNLNEMYGAENWTAVPTTEKPERFDITVSPDANSADAVIAREHDQAGMLGDPLTQKTLGKIAVTERKL